MDGGRRGVARRVAHGMARRRECSVVSAWRRGRRVAVAWAAAAGRGVGRRGPWRCVDGGVVWVPVRRCGVVRSVAWTTWSAG